MQNQGTFQPPPMYFPSPPMLAVGAQQQQPRQASGCGPVATYQYRQSTGLGIALVVLGASAIVLNGVGFAVSDQVAHVSHGFYCGAAFILTGSFGIAAGVHKAKCLIITFMTFAIITAVWTIEMLTVGLVGAVQNSLQCGVQNYGYCANAQYMGFTYHACSMIYTPPCSKGAIAVESLLATIGLFAAILLIWGSALCCRAVCCCASRRPMYGTSVPIGYGNPQVMVISQQQSSAGYGPGQQQAVTANYCNPYNPPMQYAINYWTPPPAQMQQPMAISYPTGNQPVPAATETFNQQYQQPTAGNYGMPTSPPGYTEKPPVDGI